MGMITMRTLLRDTTNIFGKIERDNEPFVIVRRGKAVAALVPIDQERAEAQILAAAPEFIKSRRSSENARAEGRTISLEEAMRLAGEASEEQEDQPGQQEQALAAASEPVDIPSWYMDVFDEPISASSGAETDFSPAVAAPDLTYLVGTGSADQVNRIAAKRVSDITDELLREIGPVQATAKDRAAEELRERFRRLNARLLQIKLGQELQRWALDRLAEISAEPAEAAPAHATDPGAGLLRRPAAFEAVRVAGDYLQDINASLASADQEQGHRGPEFMEAALRSNVSALENVFTPASVVGMTRRTGYGSASKLRASRRPAEAATARGRPDRARES
jgi:antitoxin (DNA-binding transcriptional repressor) of toxin-antitoxin stability system